ncbi:S8/S53 family peptidase [Muricoccus pecuniae]|uniref:Peptidase S8/S53 domain-containing protein n=1 Tax=Muricoccus pecuniae TaxID=693023 RepID=A0A840YI30_9PROT|nr:S8/S53 family peptidase [Roseomonas pecuniae]MBB5696111.1 hypothetical protein [Roseomonas pecuniae]
MAMENPTDRQPQIEIAVDLPNIPAIREAARSDDRKNFLSLLQRQLPELPNGSQIMEMPSLEPGSLQIEARLVHADLRGFERPSEEDIQAELRSLIAVVSVPAASAEQYIGAMRKAGLSAGTQTYLAPFDYWVPGLDRPSLFGSRRAAEALVRAGTLREHDFLGQETNLVILDEGFNAGELGLRSRSPLAFVGGWSVTTPKGGSRTPGAAARGGHGTMVALNAVSLAPKARLFDLPLRPGRIVDIGMTTGEVAVALNRIEAEIRLWLRRVFPGPWIFCHPWGIYDRRIEFPRGSYTTDRQHILNRWFRHNDTDGSGHDQIFAAGNGGQFAPHPRCGPRDIGPGHSILGANSSPHVLTVGAVRADGMWIGYSSQGPGQPELSEPPGSLGEKPDICAVSHFSEGQDCAWLSTGTSAACGMAAGAVAALRSEGSPLRSLPSPSLRSHLRQTARKHHQSASLQTDQTYDNRCGYGVLCLEGALKTTPKV